MLSPQQICFRIFNLYDQYGSGEYAGEKVSQLEHMCQSAELAMREGCDDEVVLAAFLHDIGHLIPVNEQNSMISGDGNNYGVLDHEKVGAQWLRELGVGERLCRLIESHVQAKRYLTYKYPKYYAYLSDASKKTLAFQGGRMSEEEASVFEKDPLFTLYIKMRKWDEAAKVEQQQLPDLRIFKEMLTNYLLRRSVAY